MHATNKLKRHYTKSARLSSNSHTFKSAIFHAKHAFHHMRKLYATKIHTNGSTPLRFPIYVHARYITIHRRKCVNSRARARYKNYYNVLAFQHTAKFIGWYLSSFFTLNSIHLASHAKEFTVFGAFLCHIHDKTHIVPY